MLKQVHDFQGQSFGKLRRSCLRRGALFKDPLFPASDQSLFYKRASPPGLTWKRPREICKDPRLFVDGISTRDLHQGSLGNCWMVAAISCLASEPSLWKKVIPDHVDQEWNPKRPELYAGIFHFRFWRLGHWVDVVVDDRLPVSKDGVLLFCRSATPREFWSALLEKAYAKLNGCYEALEGGNTAEALIDFTGGVSEPLSLDRETLNLHSNQRKELFHSLAKVHERKALITCSIRPADGETVESVLDCGLVRGHAYGMTAVRKIWLKTCEMSRVFMVRMRNPWGTSDWKGAWSQGSEQWQRLTRAERDKMGLIVRDVGEFWMEFHDFCQYFTDLVVCQLVDRALLWPRSHWREAHCYGEWTPAPPTTEAPLATINRGDVALIPGKNDLKYGRTKQEANREEVGENSNRKKRKCDPDKNRNNIRREKDGGFLEVNRRSRCGGCINHRDTFLLNPQVEVNRCSRVQCVLEQAASSIYMDSRSVTWRGTLTPGRFVVLPTTFLPGTTGHFLLRLFTHSHVKLWELREELPAPSLLQCLLPQPSVVTTVHLRRASGLSPHKQTAPHIYAVVRCESDTVRTPLFKEEGNPEFNLRAIFYRRYPDAYISVELWSKGLLWDSLLGEAHLHTCESEKSRNHVIDLQHRRPRSRFIGRIYIETSSSICLTDL
uniref:Si:dkey-19b23.13 n=1 Tax=Oryzias melastigma TaxID=30732 RepID=A0A3B3C037_ORYME